MTQAELTEMERIAREGARKLQASGYTYERAVEEVTAYIHRLRARRGRQRAPRSG